MNRITRRARRGARSLAVMTLPLALAATAWAQTAAPGTATPLPPSADPSPASASTLTAAPTPLSPSRPLTVDLAVSRGQLTANLPDEQALSLRATWLLGGGDVARAELVDENRFNRQGGVAAVGYTRVLSDDWFASGTLAFGRGGPIWADTRVDLEVSRKWGAAREVVTRMAVYRAKFNDVDRSDRGVRVAVVRYLPGPLVLEIGGTFNVSSPGSVRSIMPFGSATWGRDGERYVSLRISGGSEAYQALGAGQQLVDFNSHSVTASWRQWLAPRGGIVVQGELYGNPTYRRQTLGVGAFAQF